MRAKLALETTVIAVAALVPCLSLTASGWADSNIMVFDETCAVVLSISLFAAAGSASAQIDRTPKKRLISPATVKGYVGGEAHDSYVIRAEKGQTMTVQISRRRHGDNRAEISVSRSANFYTGGTVNFGVKAMGGKRWCGKIPKTGNYYVYVVAHPTANYTLRAIVN